MFYVGQKVVCVNAAPRESGGEWGHAEKPIEGNVYTITRVIPPGQYDITVLHLLEVQRDELSRSYYGKDAGYGSDRFRPLVERKTDISVFTALLNPAKQNERV